MRWLEIQFLVAQVVGSSSSSISPVGLRLIPEHS